MEAAHQQQQHQHQMHRTTNVEPTTKSNQTKRLEKDRQKERYFD